MPSSWGSSHLRDEPRSPALQADSLPSEPPGKPSQINKYMYLKKSTPEGLKVRVLAVQVQMKFALIFSWVGAHFQEQRRTLLCIPGHGWSHSTRCRFAPGLPSQPQKGDNPAARGGPLPLDMCSLLLVAGLGLFYICRYKPMSRLCACMCSVVCDSLRPHGLQPARILCLGDAPGKNTGVGCHFLLPGNLPVPGIEHRSPTLQADSLPSEPLGKPNWCYLIVV